MGDDTMFREGLILGGLGLVILIMGIADHNLRVQRSEKSRLINVWTVVGTIAFFAGVYVAGTATIH
jgi:predicted membrane-bound dolichyl-phosphate-mannose-protein mannosyltransferase